MTTLKEDLTKLFYLHGKGTEMGMKDTELASLVVDYLASLTVVQSVAEAFCIGCGRVMPGLEDGLCMECRGSGETVKPT
jgi:hypothetical protein